MKIYIITIAIIILKIKNFKVEIYNYSRMSIIFENANYNYRDIFTSLKNGNMLMTEIVLKKRVNLKNVDKEKSCNL